MKSKVDTGWGTNNPKQSLTALVVDDESEFLNFAKEMLEEHGLTVHCALSVTEAIDTLKAHLEISVIITDLTMPEHDGNELLVYVRRNLSLREIPVIVCTGHSSQQRMEEAQKLGAEDYLVKPVNFRTLLSRIHRAMEQRIGT